MIGELYPGEFEAMEHNGRMDALEQEPCEEECEFYADKRPDVPHSWKPSKIEPQERSDKE